MLLQIWSSEIFQNLRKNLSSLFSPLPFFFFFSSSISPELHQRSFVFKATNPQRALFLVKTQTLHSILESEKSSTTLLLPHLLPTFFFFSYSSI
jgi:hypothetical protein